MLLNQKQQEAVNYFDGPLRIIAGAGTGKTRVIVSKIKKLLELGIEPSKICAITFTNKAVNEIRERVFLDYNYSTPVYISTYHSLCTKILREDIDKLSDDNYKYDREFTIIKSNEKSKIIRDIFNANNKTFMDARNYKRSLNEISDFISKKKSIMQSESYNNFDVEYNKYFKMYEEQLVKNQLLDYDSLLFLTAKLLQSNSIVRTKWQSYFDYILIDEFQDSNNIQFFIIKKLLKNNNKNLTVVGDPDQNIYSWRGANKNLIEKFDTNFKNSKTIILDINYRSTNEILNLSNNLIKENYKNSTKLLKNLHSEKNGVYDKPLLNMHDTYTSEIEYVCSKIKELISKDQYSKKDITILYRNGNQSLEIEKQLTKNNIEYKIIGNISFFNRAEINRVLTVLMMAVNFSDYNIINAIEFYPNIGVSSINKLKEKSASLNISVLEFVKNHLDKLDNSTARRLNSFKDFLNKYQNIDDFKTPMELTKSLIEDFAINLYYEKEPERIDNIKELLSDIDNFHKTKDNLSITNIIKLYLENITLDSMEHKNYDNNFINLMTIHQSKGTENKIVFVVGLNEGIIPSFREKDHSEERRLLYVAMTRAKEKLFLSYNLGFNIFFNTNYKPSSLLKTLDKKLYNEPFMDKAQSLKNINNFFSINQNINKNSKFKIDNIVNHPIFGKGKVIEIVNAEILEILFDDEAYGSRNINSSILELITN